MWTGESRRGVYKIEGKSIMKNVRRLIPVLLIVLISAMVVACGANTTSETEPADETKTTAEKETTAETETTAEEGTRIEEEMTAEDVTAAWGDTIVEKETGSSVKERAGFSIREISDDLFDRMKMGNTYKEDCIVPREDLRYLLVLHKDKDGNTHQGEMVVHKLIAEDVLEIFEQLYDAGYPIERMVLPDNYMADDEIMMRDNNSSSCNFRFISHTDKISKHVLGMAVDINTLYNPYHKTVTNDDGSTEEVIEPATGKPYLDRSKDFDYKIEKGDLCYKLFTEKGFEWGGDWTDRKDYQHFEVSTDVTEKYSEMYGKKGK